MSIVIALQSATVSTPGSRYPTNVRKGEAWSSDSDIVKAHPDMFTADASRAKGAPERKPQPAVVEQSTRAPGEKSRARRVEA
jgi:hypothetical protein